MSKEQDFYLGYLVGQLKAMGVDTQEAFKAIQKNDYEEAMKISFRLEKEQYGRVKDSKELMNLFRLFRKVICLAIIPNPGEVTQEVEDMIASKSAK